MSQQHFFQETMIIQYEFIERSAAKIIMNGKITPGHIPILVPLKLCK